MPIQWSSTLELTDRMDGKDEIIVGKPGEYKVESISPEQTEALCIVNQWQNFQKNLWVNLNAMVPFLQIQRKLLSLLMELSRIEWCKNLHCLHNRANTWLKKGMVILHNKQSEGIILCSAEITELLPYFSFYRIDTYFKWCNTYLPQNNSWETIGVCNNGW